MASHGTSGPVRVGYFNYATAASKSFIKACMNVGIPFTPDFNNGTSTIGVSRVSDVGHLSDRYLLGVTRKTS